MWSQEFNVALLAAGASNPQLGAGGSGIFLGEAGPVVSDLLPTLGTKVLIGTVPPVELLNNNFQNSNIDSQAEAMDEFYMLVDPSIIVHNSILLNTSENSMNASVCHRKSSDNVLCCQFNVSFTQEIIKNDFLKHYTYHLVVFNGVRTYSNLFYGGVETCGLIACLNDSLTSCGRRFSNYSEVHWPLTFTYINIRANFSQSDQRVQFPSTLLSSIRPLPIESYIWKKEEMNSVVIRNIELVEPQTKILTFGIFGRDFERDWDPVRIKGLSNGVKLDISVIVLVFFTNLLLFL
ncbi:vanin-like protein 3 isoform X2 [Anthonomus grandis grandis]|nr:vanin-like protein 3 isoform X2 [Anthonomus grandis grandis]